MPDRRFSRGWFDQPIAPPEAVVLCGVSDDDLEYLQRVLDRDHPLGVPCGLVPGPVLLSGGIRFDYPAIDVAEPDAPAPVGDAVQEHLLFADLQPQLPAVLRYDRFPVPVSSPYSVRQVMAHFGVPIHPPLRIRPPRSFWARFWDNHHEWLFVAIVVLVAFLAAAYQASVRRP